MNTHSRESDSRMEIIAAESVRRGVSRKSQFRILESLNTEEAFSVLMEEGKMQEVASGLMERIMFYLDRRAGGKLNIECIMYTKEHGQLAASEGAAAMINSNREKWNV